MHRILKKVKSFFAVMLSFTLFTIMPAAVSSKTKTEKTDTQDKLEDTQNQINSLNQQMQNTQSQIDSLSQQKTDMEGQLNGLNQQLSDISSSLEDIESSIADKNQEIEDTKTALIEAQNKAATQYENMKLRIQFMYENGNTTFMAILFGSDSFTDFLNKTEYVDDITSYDRQMLDNYQQTQEEIASHETQLESEQTELAALQESMKGKQSEVASVISDTQTSISQYTASISDQQAVADDLQQKIDEQKAYEDELEIQKAKEDAARMAEIKRQEEEAVAAKAVQNSAVAANATQSDANQNNNGQQEANQAGNNTGTGDDSAGEDIQGTTTPDNSNNTGGGTSQLIPVSYGDQELLAALIYCEAGGESYAGQLAVGSVVLNRVSSSYYPNTISGVIYQSGQFSPVASGRLATVLGSGLTTASCRQAAQEVLNGNITNDFLYFRRNTGIIQGTVIGNHVFY